MKRQNQITKSKKVFVDDLYSRNYILLSEYTGTMKKVDIQCNECSTITNVRPIGFRNQDDKKCKDCKRLIFQKKKQLELLEIAKEKGGSSKECYHEHDFNTNILSEKWDKLENEIRGIHNAEDKV